MTLITENGYPQCSRAQCVNPEVPGTDGVRPEVLAGDVATVLVAWCAWFHRNVRPIDVYKPRDYWAWSATNDVWNSNHLSGTAVDLCASALPWQRYTMPQDQVDRTRTGLALFEGVVFWGRDWDRPDEMHFQINGNPARVAEFAAKLNTGYLNIYGPQDPNAFPLPTGYFYGPLEGPAESVSGRWEGDSQAAKDGLGRWQEALGIPVTKVWDDNTSKAAKALQIVKGWPISGWVYLGEWDAVIREGWRLPEGGLDAIKEPEPQFVKWGDYSKYQNAFVDGSYPHPAICFRASIADQADDKFLENLRRSKELIQQGKIKKVIAYHFWVPDTDNWGTFQRQLEEAGGVFPELAIMIDVEDGGSKWGISGDQSAGVNEWLEHAKDYLDNDQGVCGYLNFRSNASLWQNIPNGLKLIVPGYGKGPDVAPFSPTPIFGHQYADNEDTPPFGPTDINISKVPLSAWLAAWGVNGSRSNPPVVEEVPDTPAPPVDPGTLPDLIARQFGA
jgi:hypothetical protein